VFEQVFKNIDETVLREPNGMLAEIGRLEKENA